ncbi:hypothetical protein [Bacillus rhizoplanae]|uniref:hypothetical protein n=1 Tax=Bacillus rhizoplanae TaxID=2880966 RepID=UPI003D2083A1
MNSSTPNPKRRKDCGDHHGRPCDGHHGRPCGSSPEKCKCECSGKVELQSGLSTFIAKICPHCNIQDSYVSWSTPLFGLSFSSTFVNPPQCISTNKGTILNVTGFGTMIDGTRIVQGTFGLNLLETLVGPDIVNFSTSGFDQNGMPYDLAFSFGVLDNELMINVCNSCSCPQATNVTLRSDNIREELNELDKIREELNEGKIVIMTNGQVEIKNISDIIQKQNETENETPKKKGFFSWFKD